MLVESCQSEKLCSCPDHREKWSHCPLFLVPLCQAYCGQFWRRCFRRDFEILKNMYLGDGDQKRKGMTGIHIIQVTDEAPENI